MDKKCWKIVGDSIIKNTYQFTLTCFIFFDDEIFSVRPNNYLEFGIKLSTDIKTGNVQYFAVQYFAVQCQSKSWLIQIRE